MCSRQQLIVIELVRIKNLNYNRSMFSKKDPCWNRGCWVCDKGMEVTYFQALDLTTSRLIRICINCMDMYKWLYASWCTARIILKKYIPQEDVLHLIQSFCYFNNALRRLEETDAKLQSISDILERNKWSTTLCYFLRRAALTAASSLHTRCFACSSSSEIGYPINTYTVQVLDTAYACGVHSAGSSWP